MNRFVRGAAALGAALVTLSTATPARADTHVLRPNVIVIVLDDVGVERLCLYNPTAPTTPTPNLMQLAQSGVRFTRCYSNPLCSPTRAGIMTGRYSFRTGMGTLSTFYQLPLGEITIAELLKNGFPAPTTPYRCGAFGKWHMTTSSDLMHPINQGFDRFAGPMMNVDSHYDWTLVSADSNGAVLSTIGGPSGPFTESTYTASVTRRQAQTWIQSVQEPFFAYIAFSPPHDPFQVPPLTTVSAATRSTIVGLGHTSGQNLTGTANDDLAYDWMIESVDTEIGRLLHGIPQERLARTTILIVGDNGTPGQVIQIPPYQASHAKLSVYEQGTRVPLIAYGHGVDSSGRMCDGLVSTTDLWPTIAAITGAVPPQGVAIDGMGFHDSLRSPALACARTQAFTDFYHPAGVYVPNPNAAPPGVAYHMRAINDGTFKYVRIGTTAPVERAFDVSADPLELNDLWPVLDTLAPIVRARILALKTSMLALSGF
jgi:arylsulfatase A-like enzyme